MTRSSWWPTAFPRPWLVFIVLGLVHVAMKITLGIEVIDFRPTGDENAYVDAAKALSNLIRDVVGLLPPDTVELRRNVIGNGWFMPGMPLLLTPLYFVSPDAGIVSLRLYLGCISLALWLFAVRSVYKRLGKPYACALMVFPSLAPLWVFFSFTAWGDLYAGLMLVILLCHVFTVLQKFRQDIPLSVADGIRIGALSAACLYLRSTVLPLVPLLLAALLLASFVLLGKRRKTASIMGCFAATAVFFALLLPWSIVASKALHGRVVTTTTVPLSMAVAFGNQNELCFGHCGRGNVWFHALAYSRAIAAETGTSELDVQKSMARYATRNATARSYAHDVLGNFGRYAFNPTSFTHVFVADPSKTGTNGWSAFRWSFVNAVTSVPYYVFMAFMVVAWFTVVRRDPEAQFASILIKMFSAGMMIQPFVHISGGRYWTVFAPLFALSLGFILSTHARSRTTAASTGIPAREAGAQRLMVWIQALFIVAIVAVAVTLLWLGSP